LHWIVVQYEIDINRLPQAKETIRVRTFTKEHNRIFSYREFEIYDEDDILLLYVMTVFALIDENRKLSKIPAEVIGGYGSTENRRIRRMPKPEMPADTDETIRRDYNVGYFDIDTNFHANNSLYFIWMLEALGDEFLATHNPTHGNITFDKEVHINDAVKSYADVTSDEEGRLTSRHYIQVDDIIKCKATFQWEENAVDYSEHIK
ncbi:acyl-[acyl-carrier-protein] thioesterase, partial [Salmonella enterica subsp. enterica serovar Typhimurium]|uniref:acyl-[acyl-carrier-protein] thioesterase n=1 Tax=Salmonella enterica TaxID=28901 RepID=UPI000C223435